MGNRRTFAYALIYVLLVSGGCGGGSSAGSGSVVTPPPPPPPAADFSIAADVTAVALQQEGVSQGQTIRVTPLNGLTGTVSVAVSGLPAGVTAIPPGPYQVPTTGSGPQTSFQLAASNAAATSTSTITLTGASGSITHAVMFSLKVTAAAPFAIQVSPSSLSPKLGSLTDVQITLTANSGTSPSLLTSVSNPPPGSGVTVNGPEFLLSLTNPVTFSVAVAALAQPLQNFPLQVSASDNSGNTSAVTLPLTVTVPSATLGPTRSSFAGTENSPTGAVYDEARKLLFVTVETLNQVNVYSTTDGELMATIPTEQPIGIDETADGTKVIVGGQTAYVTVIDPDLLQVVQKVRTPLVPNPPNGETDYYFLIRPATLSNGQVLFVAQHGDTTEMHVFLWDLAAGTMTEDDFPGAIIYAQTLTRSGDHSRVLIYGISSTGATGEVYDVATSSYTASGTFPGADYLAMNADGSQVFAAGIQGNASGFYNGSLSLLANLALGTFPVSGTLYSRDGKHVYVSGTLPTGNAVTAINTATFAVEGVVPDVSGSDATVPYDIDETGIIYGQGLSGLNSVDMSSPGFFAYPTPLSFQVQPALLSTSGTTPVQLIGNLLDSNATYNVYFGEPPGLGNTGQAVGVSVASATQLNATAPAQGAKGPVNVTLARASDGWYEVEPNAATYGPTVLLVDTNAGPTAGGTSVVLYGYGLAVPNVQVSIGGKAAQVLTNVNPSGSALAAIVVEAPPGAPGYADITVSTSGGSTTVAKGFQYLSSAVVYPVSGALDDIVYDQPRQKLYATNAALNRVEVFDLAGKQYLSPIPVGKQPVGLAMTPDGSLLAIVNAGDGTVSKISLSNDQVAATYSALSSTDSAASCQGIAVTIAPVAPHQMIIDGVCNALAFSGFLTMLNLDTGTLGCAGFVTCESNGTDLRVGSGLQAMASTPNGEFVFMTDTSGNTGAEGGLVTLVNVAANTVLQNEFGGEADAAASADGTIFATDFGFHDANNIEFGVASDAMFLGTAAQSQINLVGEKLNPSGSLLFVPQGGSPATSGAALGVDIFDVHRGHLAMRADLPEQLPPSVNAMTLSETGTTMFLISNSGITIATLFEAPLSLARISPAFGASGTQVTLRGSGFVSGATVQFGKTAAAVTFVDGQTLQAIVPTLPAGPVQVTVTNPDGSSYSFDAAFAVN